MSAPSAALRCLYTDEILERILYNQPNGTSCETENQALLNISLVCKALKEPALNELWRELDSLHPILRLLPGVKLNENTYVLDGPVDPNGWDKFVEYAGRVRSLNLTQPMGMDFIAHLGMGLYQPTPTVDSSLYLAMERQKPLLPKLRSLVCIPLIREAALFLNPSLRRISLNSANKDATSAFLSAASATTNGAIHDLRITFQGSFDPAIHTCIAKFRTISRLELDLDTSLSEYMELDRSLAERNGLQAYALTAPPEWDEEIVGQDLAPGFPDLEAFRFEGGFRFLNATLARVQATTLSRVQIIIRRDQGDPGQLEWRPLLRLIRMWSSTLRTLALDLEFSSVAIPLTSLLNSLDLDNLQQFSLRNYWPIVISDLDIQTLAEKGRSLTALALVAGMSEGTVAPSIACLAHLAHHCPNLVVMEVSLKSTFSHPLKALGTHNNNFRALYVHEMGLSPDPRKEKTRAITHFLDTIFPPVCFVKDVTCADPRWEEVEWSVKRLQAARAERELGP